MSSLPSVELVLCHNAWDWRLVPNRQTERRRRPIPVENYVFRPQTFWGEGPPKSDADILCPKGTDKVGKFGAIPPTDPDGISESTLDFWPIFEFQALKNCWGRPIPSEVCISKRWSPSRASTNCEMFRGQRPLAPEIWAEIWASEKVDWVGRNESPIFRRLWTKVHQISYARSGVIAVFKPFSDRRYLVLVRGYSPSKREIRNFDVLGPNFFLWGTPNFWLNV